MMLHPVTELEVFDFERKELMAAAERERCATAVQASRPAWGPQRWLIVAAAATVLVVIGLA